MKCDVCKKEIEYKVPLGDSIQFYIISKFEMIYGDQSIYPFEVEKELICSDCIDKEKE
jgi:hypothetical protein